MLRVFALPSADQAWALRELDAAAAAAAPASPRLAELNAARAALCRQPVFVVSAGEGELARGAWCVQPALWPEPQRPRRVTLVASNRRVRRTR